MSECVIFYEWSNDDKSRFSCIFCKTEFSTAEERDKHHQKVHLIPRPQCEICNKEFSSEKALEKHLDVKHLDKASKYTTECPTCHVHVQQLRAHVRQKHENKVKLNVYGGICPHCKKSFVDDYKVKRHILQVHNNVRPYTCVECQKSFLDKKDLKRHIRGVHFGERVNRWGKYATAASEPTLIVKKQLQPIDKKVEEVKSLEGDALRSTGYGSSSTYFSADSLGTVIQTKPPELLVAEEEPDDPMAVQDNPDNTAINHENLNTSIVPSNVASDDQQLSNIEIVITPHESTEEYIETSEAGQVNHSSTTSHHAMVVTVLPEEMQPINHNTTVSKVNLDAISMLDSNIELVNLKSQVLVQEGKAELPVEVSAMEVSPVEVSAMEVAPVDVEPVELSAGCEGDAARVQTVSLVYGKFGEVVQINESSQEMEDSDVYYIDSAPTELVLAASSGETIASYTSDDSTFLLHEPKAILSDRSQTETYCNAQEQDATHVPDEDLVEVSEKQEDDDVEEEECIVIRMDENGHIDTATDSTEEHSEDTKDHHDQEDAQACLVFDADDPNERKDGSLSDSRYQLSRSRRDSTGDLVLELVEKDQSESTIHSETKFITVRWGEEVIPRSKGSSFPFPTVDRRLPEMLFSETTEKICEEPTAEKVQDPTAAIENATETAKVSESTAAPQKSSADDKSGLAPTKKKIRRKVPEPTVIDENTMECPAELCTQKFKGKHTIFQYQKHYERIHLQLRNHVCEHCDFKFFSKHDLGRHIESVHSKIRTVCPIAGCKRLVVRLDLHIKNVHNPPKPKDGNRDLTKCDSCGQTFNRAYDLKRHNDTVHLGHKKFKCNVCDRGFTDKRDLVRHHAAVHLKIKQKKVYTCTNCEQKYKRKKDLVEHIAALECRILS